MWLLLSDDSLDVAYFVRLEFQVQAIIVESIRGFLPKARSRLIRIAPTGCRFFPVVAAVPRSFSPSSGWVAPEHTLILDHWKDKDW